MSLHEPFEYDLRDLLWRLYSTTRFELKTYGRSVAENLLIWILCYYIICIILYLLIFYYKNWSCTKLKGAKRALFVTAHPDDECMFFGPTIVHFVSQGIDVHLLCLSSGDHEGRGSDRRKELWRACDVLGIPAAHVTLVHDTDMQDDPNACWAPERIAQLLLHHVEALAIDTLVTFDRHGVSGHANHTAIFYAVAYLCTEKILPKYCSLLTLDSVNVLRKYWGYLDLPLSFLLASHRFVLPLKERRVVVNSMKEHKSQMVWFRYLYLLFSRFVVINTLKEVTLVDVELELDLDD